MHLDSKPLREWDEARNAINAYEMSLNNNYIVRTYDEQPDLWETKPPLLVWMQVIGFRTLGYGELAVRLPSAIATFVLCIFLVWYFNRHFKLPLIGIFASLVLVTSNGYINDHASRTGDHDSLLVCFEMIALLTLFMYFETKQTTQLVLHSIFLMLCIYTKSISIFFFFPGVIFYLLISGRFGSVFRDQNLIIGFVLAILTASYYYLAREIADKGYLRAVWENEMFPRYLDMSQKTQYNRSEFWYYLKQIMDWQFSYWIWFLVPALIFNFATLNDKLWRLHNFIFVNAICFLVVISSGTTNEWYDLPLLALFSIIIGIALFQFIYMLYTRLRIPVFIRYFLFISLIGIAIVNPYADIIAKVTSTDEPNNEVQFGYMFRDMESKKPEIRTFRIYNPSGHNYPMMFYKRILTKFKSYDIRYVYLKDLPGDAEYVVLLDYFLPEIISAGVKYDLVLSNRNCLLIKIKK